MKVAVIFVLLFATVLCRPAGKVAESSSESSEEVMRRPAAQPQDIAAPVQNVAAAADSDESTASSDEDEQVAAKALVELKSASTDTTSSPDTASVNSEDSEDSDDHDDDDDDDADESETEEDEAGESSESGESSTLAPTTVNPLIVTEDPFAETTVEPIMPTIVTDTRGDSLGGYPSDYKSIVYAEDKSYHKVPSPYKSYEYMGTGKKMAYDMTEDNEVDKSPKMYKALQIHNNILEEDTSTPDVESQGLDVSYSTSQDQDLSLRQATIPEEEEDSASTSESTSAPEEEEKQSDSSTSVSTSTESEDEDSLSSEEATATPGAADSESDESPETDSDEDEVVAPDATTDIPVFITAK